MTMKIELKKISHNATLSEETHCFSAQVWVDGVHFFDVSNHGQGGPDDQRPANGKTDADIEKLNAAVIAERGQDNTHGIAIDIDLEIVVCELVNNHLTTKVLTRLLKRTVAYFDPKAKTIYSFKKLEGEQRAHVITETMRKHPEAKILNNLPFDQALAIYRANS